MFIGHYGAALAAKRWTPRLSLAWLFLAVQLVDVLFAVLVLGGVEKVRIVPGFTATNPYDLHYMPYTHSLVGALVWSALAALAVRALLRGQDARAAVAVAACVFSHWLLDAPMHTPDMPLLGDDSPKVGFGLWHHRHLTIVIELAVFAAGAWLYLRATGGLARARAGTIVFLGALAALAVATPFMPPPSSPTEMAISMLAAYFAIAGAAAWIDRARRPPS